MTDAILISIIIPAYNAERILSRCLDSVSNQSYTHFEVLLINDGSTDGTASLCDKWAESDSRFRVFHKANGGVSSARNVGLANARGDYICFVDSDDWIEGDYLQQFIEHRQGPESLVFFNHYVDKPEWTRKKWDFKDVVYHKANFSEVFSHLNFMRIGIPFSKLFSSKIVKEHQLRFDEDVHYAEDLLFILSYLRHVTSLKYSDYAGYHYVKHDPNSLSKSYNSFASEYKAFTGIKSQVHSLLHIFNLDAAAHEKIKVFMGTFFLRPIQAFYRNDYGLTGAERQKLLQQAHTAENMEYLQNLRRLGLPVSIRLSLVLYKKRLFGLYDSYMRLLFKYHRLKSTNR